MLSKINRHLKNYFLPRSAYKFFIKDWKELGELNKCADAVATMRHSINLEPVLLEGAKAERILVIAPHPDDEMLGPGGTLIKAISKGIKVRTLYLTKGKPNQSDLLVSETEKIAKKVGYETRYFDYHSRQLPIDNKILDDVKNEIEEFKPQIIMLPFFCDDHDDHRRASHILWSVKQVSKIFENIEIWAYQVYTALIPNVVVDITEIADKKSTAIKGWSSQAGSRDWSHFALGLNAFNSRFLQESTKPSYVEAFFVLPANDYFDICAIYFSDDTPSSYYLSNYD